MILVGAVIGGAVCLLLGFLLGIWATVGLLGAGARRRAAAGLAPSVAPPAPPPAPPPSDVKFYPAPSSAAEPVTHVVTIHDHLCDDGHPRVVAVCHACAIAAPVCWGASCVDTTRFAALERIERRLSTPINGAKHVLPEGEPYEMAPSGLPS